MELKAHLERLQAALDGMLANEDTTLSQSDTPLGRWLKAMIERGAHRNAVAVALANKLARIAWTTLRKDATFERGYPVAA